MATSANLALARAQAEMRARSIIQQRGLDPAQYEPLVKAEFDRISAAAPADIDPKGVFADNIASAVLDGEQARLRNQYLQQTDEKFGSNYGQKAITSSLLDDTIQSILSEQRQGAEQYLDRGKARGIYNDVGYNAGRSAIDSAANIGRAKLGSMGHDVINKYRTDADAIRDKAYGEASGFQLGRQFSLDPYISQANELVGRANSNASGDLRGAIGGTNFFDLSALTNRAGQAQGAMNFRDADVASALKERRRVNATTRGLGSQGAF